MWERHLAAKSFPIFTNLIYFFQRGILVICFRKNHQPAANNHL